jgi:hypothetical protein
MELKEFLKINSPYHNNSPKTINNPILFRSNENFYVIGKTGYYSSYFKIEMEANYITRYCKMIPRKQFAYFVDKEGDQRFLFGGKNFSTNILFDDFWCINSNNEIDLIKKMDIWPSERRGATMFKFKDFIYLYGGINTSNITMNEIYR